MWKLAVNNLIATLHVQVSESVDEQKILANVQKLFKEWGVSQVTIQIEKESFLSTIPINNVRGAAISFPSNSMRKQQLLNADHGHSHG